MAVTARYTAVSVVDAKLGALIAAGFPPTVNGIPLGAVVAACAVGTAALYIPASFRVRYNMVRIWSFGHVFLLVAYQQSAVECGDIVIAP